MNRMIKYFLLSLLVVAFGQIYFLPFVGDIRFSAGIVALSLIILIVNDIDKLILCFTCGITVFVFRVLLSLGFVDKPLIETVTVHAPALFYYISFGIILKIFSPKDHKYNLHLALIVFAFADSLSNILETILRRQLDSNVIKFIIIVACIRSFTACFAYLFYIKEKLFISNKEHQRRYTELNLLISNIQAEMFYLRKSMKDIETVMSKSHKLYEDCKDNDDIKSRTLDIAREVHEIKKDYYRVLNGFEVFVKSLEKDEGMTLSSIGAIIKDNTYRTLQEKGRDIKVSFNDGSAFIIKPIYKLFTILNNLIINSIEACSDGDEITVSMEEEEGNIIFKISDTGEGINEDEVPYIFNPGFTTKYNEATGKASTGIGLSHVKNIVEDMGGTITFVTKAGSGTTFTVTLPKTELSGG